MSVLDKSSDLWYIYAMRIRYNAPVTLSFALLAVVVLILDGFSHNAFRQALFSTGPRFAAANPLSWVRLVVHPLGHLNWNHLLGNMAFILLLGPALEEKHTSRSLLAMMVITAVITGLLNLILSNSQLLGASGIVFMMIVLSSITNIRSGDIPLTFVFVLILFLAREFLGIFRSDTISQLAHIVGGICGSLFGLLGRRSSRS